MALYGQTSEGIREDMGLIRARVEKLEGGGTTTRSTSVSVPGKDGADGADGTILNVATAPTFTGTTASQIKADLASLVTALTAAGVFK